MYGQTEHQQCPHNRKAVSRVGKEEFGAKWVLVGARGEKGGKLLLLLVREKLAGLADVEPQTSVCGPRTSTNALDRAERKLWGKSNFADHQPIEVCRDRKSVV